MESLIFNTYFTSLLFNLKTLDLWEMRRKQECSLDCQGEGTLFLEDDKKKSAIYESNLFLKILN